MIFTELRFFAFFALVLGVYWALGNGRARKIWLLLASYAFYAAWDWRFLSLILVSTAVDYAVGLALGRTESSTARRGWLSLSVVTNLGILGFFKYYDFFAESAGNLLEWLGLGASPAILGLVLPVGISFYTFQTLSYSIDVYRGRLEPCMSPLDLALFVAFFPQLVAGPIVRAASFLPQLVSPRTPAMVPLRSAALLFLAGFVKKACLSDGVARAVDAYFASPESFTAASAWIAVGLYAVQIYCDFSGYSDMAIATAAFLGYDLGENFRFPYLASNIADFWRRWHISLSAWLRDYLYIPLGGSRGSRLATTRNLLLTMLLGGLWHGAAWRFVLWGALHGVALVVHREWRHRLGEPRGGLAGRLAGTALTFLWVCFAWIFFRAESLEGALAVVRAAVLGIAGGPRELSTWWLLLLGGLLPVHAAAARGIFRRFEASSPGWLFAAACGAATALALAFAQHEAAPFIYFQF